MNIAHMAALANPLNTVELYPEQLQPLTHTWYLPGGNILRVILTVDADGYGLFNGDPFWHASVTITTPDLKHRYNSANLIGHCAESALEDVGGDCEYWAWNSRHAVGHLRVPLTLAELGELASWPAQHDARPHGIRRARTGRMPSPVRTWTKPTAGGDHPRRRPKRPHSN
jgi:hypothetical protein